MTLVNIEKEYKDHLFDAWLELSDKSQDVCDFTKLSQAAYEKLSLDSDKFLKEKLESLEKGDNL